jgi:Dockerin type I domain
MRQQAFTLLACTAMMVASGALDDVATADDTNALIMNQYNAVSGSVYLKNGKSDGELGRVEGNGQNWLQFLTTKADPGKNTLDLQGYQIDWSYDKGDGTSSGSGSITFSNDPVWAAVPMGTAINITEDQQVWYLNNTPPNPPNPDGDPTGGGGMQRDGDIDGLGVLHGTPYTGNPALETLINFSSNTAWNPYAQAGANMAPGPNWNINVYAGQQSNGAFQYFNFAGSVTKNGVTSAIGTEAGGLFVANNDNWQFTIKDSHGNIVQGPIGEALASTNPPGWGGSGIGSDELGKVQAFAVGTNPTLSDWQHVTGSDYFDGSTSNFGGLSQWTVNNQLVSEDLSPLRSWFSNIKPGDVNLDGVVNGLDVNAIAANWLHSGVGLQAGDANGDGVVNGLDINVIASHWLQSGGAPGSGSGSGANVPEPASYVLCAIGAVACLVGRSLRRRSDC